MDSATDEDLDEVTGHELTVEQIRRIAGPVAAANVLRTAPRNNRAAAAHQRPRTNAPPPKKAARGEHVRHPAGATFDDIDTLEDQDEVDQRVLVQTVDLLSAEIEHLNDIIAARNKHIQDAEQASKLADERSKANFDRLVESHKRMKQKFESDLKNVLEKLRTQTNVNERLAAENEELRATIDAIMLDKELHGLKQETAAALSKLEDIKQEVKEEPVYDDVVPEDAKDKGPSMRAGGGFGAGYPMRARKPPSQRPVPDEQEQVRTIPDVELPSSFVKDSLDKAVKASQAGSWFAPQEHQNRVQGEIMKRTYEKMKQLEAEKPKPKRVYKKKA